MSDQEEGETRLIRKAKPHQRSRWQSPRDRALSQTQENSPFAVPQAQEQRPKERQQQQGPPRRSSRRSASASPPTEQIEPDTQASHNKGEGQIKSRRRGRLPKNTAGLLVDAEQTVQQSSHPHFRTRSKTRSSSEGLTPPSQPRGRRTASVEHSSNTKAQDTKRTKRTPKPPTPVASQSLPDMEQQVMGPPKTRARRGGRKKKPLASEDSAADISSEDLMSDKDSISQKRKPRGKKGTTIKETTEEVDNSKWTDQELQKLHG